MPITPLPALDRTSATFKTDVDTFFATQIPTFCTEANALEAALNAIAAGGAMAIPYTFDSTTTDADPTSGKLRLSSATQNTSAVIRADLVGSDGSTWTSVIDTFDDSTSTIKGYIRLVCATNATKWLIFSVSALASPTGYKNITVSCVASSAASPFTNGDPLIMYFTRTGDAGAAGSMVLGVPVASTSGTSIDFTSIPAGTKHIVISFNAVSTTGTSPLLVQIGDSGGIEATGYVSTCMKLEDGLTLTAASSTSGYKCETASGATYARHGAVTLTLENSTNNTWAVHSSLRQTTVMSSVAAGTKSLSATLDRVRITTEGGTDTFDAGEINIAYI